MLSHGQSIVPYSCWTLLYFFKFIFREQVREGEKEGEKHQSVASWTPPTGDLACNPGMCPDWELNRSIHWATPARRHCCIFCGNSSHTHFLLDLLPKHLLHSHSNSSYLKYICLSPHIPLCGYTSWHSSRHVHPLPRAFDSPLAFPHNFLTHSLNFSFNVYWVPTTCQALFWKYRDVQMGHCPCPYGTWDWTKKY